MGELNTFNNNQSIIFRFIFFSHNQFQIIKSIIKIFAIIVFACIAQEGYWNGTCSYNGSTACGYGIAIGVIAFIIALAFTIIDIFLKNVSSASIRKMIVLGELVAAGNSILLFIHGILNLVDSTLDFALVCWLLLFGRSMASSRTKRFARMEWS